jgi:hypothetical protein
MHCSDDCRLHRNSFLFAETEFCPPPVVAHKSTSTEIGILRKVFQKYDKRGVGHLNYEEFKASFTAVGYRYTEGDYRKMFDAVVRWSVGL